MSQMVDPKALLKLLHGEFSSLTIGFNDCHACNYERASEEFYAPGGMADNLIEWVSGEEREKAIRENSVWTIQWYPQTPNGFHCVGASTFDAAARFALGIREGAAEMTNSALRDAPPRLSMIGNIGEMDE